jgi:hypothetical protein
MTRRIIATRNAVIAAQGLVALAEQGIEVVDDKIRAIAAGRRIPGTEDDYEVVYEDQPA